MDGFSARNFKLPAINSRLGNFYTFRASPLNLDPVSTKARCWHRYELDYNRVRTWRRDQYSSTTEESIYPNFILSLWVAVNWTGKRTLSQLRIRTWTKRWLNDRYSPSLEYVNTNRSNFYRTHSLNLWIFAGRQFGFWNINFCPRYRVEFGSLAFHSQTIR